ncbi:YD repeat-containing protein [Burkholderia pseudomallei]|uniref:RHS repeat-associated core domain-containing protein n=1 Tax=Burkholderia pseudomallei TaxID=28450 RepID=UPI0005DC5ECE|nr:RHS repeat-associated core domain-containing protein [Burkholderia pseudomallei]CFU00862.1 YD repeat-containing protein [Burkholderia pseudomallei]CPI08774.1 YD repeat-containing protein [Burkholderia pseudomallei]
MSRIGQKFLCAIAFVLAQLAVTASHADEVRYYATDALHSVTVVMDEKGNVVEKTYYAPYGEVLNRALRDAPGYGGHEEDAATGLVYMQQRYYDPVVGRFLSVDPIEAQGSGESFNRYDYALNNPYSFTDPDGRCAGSAATGMAAASCNQARDGDGGSLSSSDSVALADSLSATNGFDTSSGANGQGGSPSPIKETLKGVAKEISNAVCNLPIVGCDAGDSPLAASNQYQATGMMAGGVIVQVAGAVATDGESIEVTAARGTATGASSAANALRLNKALASEAQMAETGTRMAGTGARVPFRNAQRIAAEYGGNPADWVKMTSSTHTARDGVTFETHWVENVRTGQRVEFKTKFPGGN